MKSLVQKLLLLSLLVAIALPLAAQDKEKKKKGGGGGAVAQLKKTISSLDLSEDQKKKIEGVFAEFQPKIAEATKAAGDAPKRVADARKKLSEEGKKGKELNAAATAAAKLSADEQKAVDKLSSLTQDLRTAVAAVLTDEQKDKAGLSKGKKKKNKNA
jgi:Spy/CpxP family protein refolding chaperone